MLAHQDLPVIPVLDILAGQVVRARRGQRSAYRPIVSALVHGCEPVDVARALLRHPACSVGEPRLYVADLDALQGRPAQARLLADLLQALEPEFAGLSLWLDAGFTDTSAAAALRSRLGRVGAMVRPVYGSESLADLQALEAIAAEREAILSLDSRGSRPLDPAGCWQHAERWPGTVIVMTLDRVGTDLGPDLHALATLRAASPAREWIGAGGLRQRGDLAAARAAGASAWLVASALHDGTLQP